MATKKKKKVGKPKKLLTFRQVAEKAMYARFESNKVGDAILCDVCFEPGMQVDDEGNTEDAILFLAVNDSDMLDEFIFESDFKDIKRVGKTNEWMWGDNRITFIKGETL